MTVSVIAVVNRRRATVELEDPTDENIKALKRALFRCGHRPFWDSDAQWWIIRTECLNKLKEHGIEVRVVK